MNFFLNQRPSGAHGRPRLIAMTLVLLAGAAAASVPATSTQPATEVMLEVEGVPEVPKPDLSAMEEAAQQKVRLAQTTLERAIRAETLTPRELAEGFGFLGQLYHAYKLLDAAEACYLEANLALPEDSRWAYLLGLTRFAKGDLERSVENFESALAVRPGDSPTLVRLGNAMIELNRPSEARRYFDQALEVEPTAAAALYGLGKAAALDGEDSEAVEYFERTLELQSDASIVHYPLGQAYRRLGEREKAVEHLRQRGQDEVSFADPLGREVSRLAKGTALEVVIDMARDSERFTERDFLGFALSQFGQVEGTIEQLAQWLAVRGDAGDDESRFQNARLYYVLGGLQVSAGRDEEALENFRRAVSLEPGLVDARVKLGNALARSGDLESALAEYERVVADDSQNVDALLKRATAHMELENWSAARTDLERLVVLDSARAEVRGRLAAVLVRLDDREGALEQYRQALELDLGREERLRIKTRVADLLAAGGAVEESIAEFRELLKMDSSYMPAISGLAAVFTSLGRFGEAAELYGKWAEVEPEVARPRLIEATALIFAGEYSRASERLEAAIGAFPGVIDFKDLLARHLAACPDMSQRDGERALELALAVRAKVPSVESAETVAMAYAQSGLFAQAIDWQGQLVAEAEQEAPPEVTARLRANLERYQSGLACCASSTPTP